MSLTTEEIIEAIGSKSLIEVMELVHAMEEKFGVSAAAPVAAAAGPAAAAAAVEEQTEFNVVLAAMGEKVATAAPITFDFRALPQPAQ